MPVSLPIGFNFRQAEAFVTDTAPNVWARDGGVHPYSSTPGWGWVSDTVVDTANRNTLGGERLAGILFVANNASPADAEFRVDTGSGTFNIRIAIGDYDASQGPHKIEFFDGASGTPILTLTPAATGAAQRWFDATGVRRDGVSTWESSNAQAQITLANAYLRVRFGEGSGSGSNYTTVSHLRIDAVAVPNAPTGVTSGSVTATSATCSWTDASSDETSFDVQYAPSPYTSWPPLTGSPTAANATSLATGNVLTDGTSYKFRVRSTNSNGSSAWVESGVFTTIPLTKLRPVSDTTVGAWTSTGANLWSVLDEAAADDVDFISVTSGSTFKIKLQSSTNPGSTANHTVQIRMKGDGVSQLTLALVQGHPSETLIKSQTFTPTTSYAPYTMTLSSGEAATITNYGDLYLKGTSL